MEDQVKKLLYANRKRARLMFPEPLNCDLEGTEASKKIKIEAQYSNVGTVPGIIV